MKHTRSLVSMIAATTAVGLSACGGGSGAGIGGSLSGLNTGQSVTLQDNNADSLTLTANGSFRFATDLNSDTSYSVTILTQPAGEVCEVANGTGAVDSSGDSVTSVAIACVTTSSLGGAVSGLAAGAAVTLSNGTVLLPVATNGPFAFPGNLVAGTNYEVTVATQPLGESCTVTNGVGAITAASESPILVTCS